MGTMYKISCTGCDYKLSFYEGIGMMYSPNRVFYAEDGEAPLLASLVKGKRIKEKAFLLLTEGAEPEEYGHELYGCKKCHRLADRFHFRLSFPAGQYEPDYRCSRCKKELVPVRGNEPDDQGFLPYLEDVFRESGWSCPKCNDAKLTCEMFGLWD